MIWSEIKHKTLVTRGPVRHKVLSGKIIFSCRDLQFSWEEREGWKLLRPGSFHGSSVNVAVVAFPEAEAERVEVEFTPAVVAQQLPLIVVLSQGETQVGIIGQEEVSCGSSPERRSWGDRTQLFKLFFIVKRKTSPTGATQLFRCGALPPVARGLCADSDPGSAAPALPPSWPTISPHSTTTTTSVMMELSSRCVDVHVLCRHWRPTSIHARFIFPPGDPVLLPPAANRLSLASARWKLRSCPPLPGAEMHHSSALLGNVDSSDNSASTR